MNRCPITYEPCGNAPYSERGLKLLHRNLKVLNPLQLTAEDQRQEALARATKMSIQGMQYKVSARLKMDKGTGSFEIVDRKGSYILKPQSPDFAQLPENEDLTMKLAAIAGIEVPVHGMVYSKDNSLTYFIQRFDRKGLSKKIHVEDFAQLTGASRDVKYNSSMERVAKVIDDYCTFPILEKAKLLRRTLFCFLVGNEDMHLKNFSLIYRGDKIELSPAYDMVNSTIAMPNAGEEMALPIDGRKNNFNKANLIDYYAFERLKLPPNAVDMILENLAEAIPQWMEVINRSFLGDEAKEKYRDLVKQRAGILGL